MTDTLSDLRASCQRGEMPTVEALGGKVEG